MKRTIFTLCLLFLFSPAVFALNALHDAQYQFHPEIFQPNLSRFGIAMISADHGYLQIPLNLKFGLNERFELGSRLNFNAYDSYYKEIETSLDLGIKLKLSNHETLQADVLFGLNRANREGLALSYTTMRSYTSDFKSIFNSKLAFFEGLVGDEFAMMELSAHPYTIVWRNVRGKCSFIFSTGAKHPIDTFAWDLEPGLMFPLKKVAEFHFDITLGVWGAHKESFRAQMGINHAF